MFIRDFLLRQVFLAMLLSGNLLVVTTNAGGRDEG